MNLEYNELETLLRCSACTECDKMTGFSVFPGTTNQFVCRLEPYVDNLERTKGAIPESVKAGAEASHLECRMQDFVFVLQGREAKKVGYTCVSARLCYSPVANTAAEGSALQANRLKPACVASAEADQYSVHRIIMRSIGCQIVKTGPQTYSGLSVVSGSQIVLKPSVVCFPGDYPSVFPNPEKVKISARSSLVVTGVNVTIHSLDLDGALVIHGVAEGGEVKGLVIRNKGWSMHTDVESEDGYRLEKKETAQLLLGLGQEEQCTIL
jgi:UDP-sugar pyrophosphorylase